MKRLLFLYALVLCTLSAAAQNISTRVTGKAGDVETVYLLPVNAKYVTDSAKVVNGMFGMNVNGVKNSVAFITTKNKGRVLIITDGMPVKVNLKKGTVEGSELGVKLNDIYRNLEQKTSEVELTYAKFKELKEQGDKADKAELKKISEQLNAEGSEIVRLTLNGINENKDNIIGLYLVNKVYGDLHPEYLMRYVNSIRNTELYDSPLMDVIKKYIESTENRFMGLSFPDRNNKLHKMGEWCGKNKVVLVDFGTSWSMQFVHKMPKLIEIYNKYKNSGMEVISVSFDDDRNVCLNSFKALGIQWPLLFGAGAWEKDSGKPYGINSVPSNVLIDRNGRFIAFNIYGDELKNKLNEIFGK